LRMVFAMRLAVELWISGVCAMLIGLGRLSRDQFNNR
jgi:hypothetical protein